MSVRVMRVCRPAGPVPGLVVFLALLAAGCGGEVPVLPSGPPVLALEDLDGDELLGVGPEVTRETPEGFHLRFAGRREGVRSALAYARSRVTAATPVEIRLNGVLVAEVTPSDPFRTAPEVLLPAALLRGDDELAFVPTAPGPWQVGELRVVVDPLPACAPGECETRARELFERAELLHADRAVAAGNLARASSLLREALLHVERVDPPPPLRGRIATLLAAASGELDDRCRGLRFAAVGQVHLGRWDELRATALAMADRFPGASHPCHRTARRLLERLAELEE
jgi:hypothetical protein